jgi:hypothetical protein
MYTAQYTEYICIKYTKSYNYPNPKCCGGGLLAADVHGSKRTMVSVWSRAPLSWVLSNCVSSYVQTLVQRSLQILNGTRIKKCAIQ